MTCHRDAGRMPVLRLAAGAAIAAAAAALAVPATAQSSFEIEVCNRSPYTAAVASSYQRASEFNTDYWYFEGWDVIRSGACQVIGYTPNRYFYIYATEHNNPDRHWAGDFNLCADYPGPFGYVLHIHEDCPRGSSIERFTQYYISPGYTGMTVYLD